MATKVKFFLPVVERNTSSGELTSYACGQIASLDDEVATAYITGGFAEAYTLITPTGTKTITENGEDIDVAAYAKVTVNVTTGE